MRGWHRRMAVAAKVLTVAIGLAVALPVVPASAMGTMTANLNIGMVEKRMCFTCVWFHEVKVEATVPLSPGETVYVTDHRVEIRLWGDDPSYDDLLQRPLYIRYTGWDQGQCHTTTRSSFYSSVGIGPGNVRIYGDLKIRGCLRVPTARLNEDTGIFEGQDEIYAGVRLVSPHTGTVRLAESNRVRRNFLPG